jgi:tetratricopeptide (TPR) repeat protein
MRDFSTKRIYAPRHLILALLLAAAAAAFAQTTVPQFYEDAPEASKTAIVASRALTEEGKWLQAWKGLEEFDPENKDGFALAEKIRIALDGHAQTMMHLAFGFVDLEEGQDLETLRYEADDSIEPLEFNPGDFTMAIEDSGEAVPPVLSLAMGNYYHTVWTLYQGQWLQDDTTLLSLAAEHYERAFAYEAFTSASLDNHAEVLLALERFDAAEAVVNKALEISPEDSHLMLHLADIYFSSQRFEQVFPLADKIIALSANDEEVNNGYIVAIKSGLSLRSAEILEKYIGGLEAAFPMDYMPGLIRHLAAVQMGDKEGAQKAADAVTAKFPGNPDIIRSILSTWLSANDAQSGFDYLVRSLETAPGDESRAALYFYKALLGGEVAESPASLTEAMNDLALAEEYFKKSYPAGHEVFGMIKEVRLQWEEAIASYNAMIEEQAAAIAAAAEAAAEAETESEEDADATSAASDEDW